jgi:hypothetical protein
MANEERYTRRISSEEAKKGYIFILKDKLSFFPAREKPFSLSTETLNKSVTVESYRCTCRGPDLPHDHYFIRWEGLRFGDRISITRDAKAENQYFLTRRR